MISLSSACVVGADLKVEVVGYKLKIDAFSDLV